MSTSATKWAATHGPVQPGARQSSRAEGDHVEPIAIGSDHVDGLSADRTGGTDERDPSGRCLCAAVCVRPGYSPSSQMHQSDQVVGRRQNEQQSVEPVEDAAMAGQQRSHVLQAEIAFHERLAKIPDRGDDAIDHS